MVATTCTQPLDTLKVRVQVAAASGKSVSPLTVAPQTLRNEGALVFYKGLSAGLMRQVIYTGGRFGLFDTLIERSRDPMFDSVPGFAKKSFCAITAGGAAAELPQRRARDGHYRQDGRCGGALQGSFLDVN